MTRSQSYSCAAAVVACLLLSGCVTTGISHIEGLDTDEKPVVALRDLDVTFGGVGFSTQDQAAAEMFLTTFGTMVDVRADARGAKGLVISGLKVESNLRCSRGGALAFAILTTPLPFLSPLRSRCPADLLISYMITDASGGTPEKRLVRRKVRAGFGGWSYNRAKYKIQLLEEMKHELPKYAAEVLAKDIRDWQLRRTGRTRTGG